MTTAPPATSPRGPSATPSDAESGDDIVRRLGRDVFYGDNRLALLGSHNLLHLDAINEIERLRADKDGAYQERNQVVAALASLFPSGIARTDIPGWLPEWHRCVYIDLPTGQASWHYHDSQHDLFAHLPTYTKEWDGHTTPQKYERLALLAIKQEGVDAVPPSPAGASTTTPQEGEA